VMLVCDSNVTSLYADDAEKVLSDGGNDVFRVVFPAGESSKTMNTISDLLEHMGEAGLTRTDTVIALGGGVTSDIAGFAASIYARGIDAVYVPTTLLAAVDASVGGKTGVDLSCGKNLAGSFHQPRLVLCDCDLLRTLPESEFSNGMAEVIKYALAFDGELFSSLENAKHGDMDVTETVFRCCKWKAACVEQDERDMGIRCLLNLGHTAGHAIEKLSGYTVPHGCAVAVGLCIMTRSAERSGFCERGSAARLETLCRRFGLPTCTEYSAEELFRAAASDKKRAADTLTIAVPTGIGKAVLKDIPFDELLSWLQWGIDL